MHLKIVNYIPIRGSSVGIAEKVYPTFRFTAQFKDAVKKTSIFLPVNNKINASGYQGYRQQDDISHCVDDKFQLKYHEVMQ